MLRIPIPALTEERRKELSRHVHKMAEEGRNHVRVVRREANDKLKKMLKEHQISEDDEKRALDEVQKITDAHIKMIDDLQQQERPGAAWEIATSRISSAAAAAARVRSIRASAISSARPASCRCSPATTSRRRGRGRSESLADRAPNMWRYRELMPLLPGDEPVTLGEGFTPLIHAKRLGATLGLDRLFIKDESLNPTNSFKARGLSAAITRAKALGATTVALPTAGNAGNAAAAYCGRRRHACEVFIPKDAKQPFIDECRLYGANVTLVDGLITDAGRVATETGQAAGLVRRLDAPRAVPRRRQEDDGLRAGRAARLDAARLDHLSDRRRHRPDRHVEGVRRDGSHRLARRRASGRRWCRCRPTGCAPIVRAFEQGAEKAGTWENAHTVADGLRVPRAIGDFLILRAVRESGGTARRRQRRADGGRHAGDRPLEGVTAAPEGGAALSAVRQLVAEGQIKPHETVVLFNTGGALKYLEVLKGV